MSSNPSGDSDLAGFILANTRLLSPPHVPEIVLHLAEESLPIWQKTEEELGEMNVPPPFWAFAWAGGQALARYVLDHPETVSARSVLDLGSGSGLAAIAAMKSGAKSALAADIDQFALASISLNAAANDVHVTTTSADLLAGQPLGHGTVLVGDLFYERELAERVLAYLQAASAAGAIVLVGDPGRSYFPTHSFINVADYELSVTRELEDTLIKKTAVWSLGSNPIS